MDGAGRSLSQVMDVNQSQCQYICRMESVGGLPSVIWNLEGSALYHMEYSGIVLLQYGTIRDLPSVIWSPHGSVFFHIYGTLRDRQSYGIFKYRPSVIQMESSWVFSLSYGTLRGLLSVIWNLEGSALYHMESSGIVLL